MANPWMRKNPWLSMWMSAANQSMGAAQGLTQAAARRQVSSAQTEATRQITELWMASAGFPAKRRKAPRR